MAAINRRAGIIVWSLLLLALGLLASVASPDPADEAGANINAPESATEGGYRVSTLGSSQQPMPESFAADSVYGSRGAWPTVTPELAPGAGRNEVKAYCSLCHNTTYINMQPPLSAEKWQAVVHKMLNTFGAKEYIPQQQVPLIIHYLQTHYTPDTIGR